MEEQVGELWHRLITRLARTRYPEAAVSLREVAPTVGVLFRALGGDGGLQVETAQASEHGARRGLLQRIAGSDRKVELAWRNEQHLRLPAEIDCFPEKALNRDLYLWLAALAAHDAPGEEPWLQRNQRLSRQLLDAYPGLRPRYRRLVTAHLQQRQQSKLSQAEALQEAAIRQSLREPGSVTQLPPAPKPPQPVPLWLHPFPPSAKAAQRPSVDGNGQRAGHVKQLDEAGKRRAEQAEQPKQKHRGLVTIRMENIFTWGGFRNLDRGEEEHDDLDQAADAARELEVISVSPDAKGSAGRLRFDLDLPAASEDDLVLNDGILLPEWDYKHQRLVPDLCQVVAMLPAKAGAVPLPQHLRKAANKLRAQFQHLAPSRVWHRAQQDGSEIDIDAYLRFAADRHSGHAAGATGLYRELRAGSRDLACLLLADLSLSTDTWVDDRLRVIDVIRDSLYLFAESLAATGDAFALYGFSSRKRDPIRFHQLKRFGERYDGTIRGRIQAIKPGYYTRLGAAIRHSANLLKVQGAERRLLLILTDGKPNDLDRYEGRYGIEDTRQALFEARALGLQPFCITIDSRANDYLPHLFGSGNYVVIRRPSQLPKALPRLYLKLTS